MKKIFIIGIDHVVAKTTYLYDYAKKKGCEVVFFTSDDAGFSKDTKFQNIVFLKFGKILSILKILFYLTFRRPTHVELYFSRIYFETFPTLIACKLLFIPVSLVSRGKDLRDHKEHRYIRRVLTKFICRNVNLILPKEKAHVEVLSSFNISKEIKIHEIHNGIPIDDFNKSKFSIKSSTFLFLNAFRELRNVDILIEAFSKLNIDFPETKLLLVGSSLEINFLPQEQAHEKHLVSLINKFEIQEATTILPFSSNPWQKVEEVLAFVLPADQVWLNNALLEAMAFSVPPIIAEAERANDIVLNGVNGLICAKDSTSLFRAMASLMHDPKKAELMGRESRKKVISNFSSDTIGEEILNTYKENLWIK